MDLEASEAPVLARVEPATVAIVGRPNVGKSALFNRLVGARLAIVEDTPGVTRDRLYALAEWQGRTFNLVDTAGIDAEAAVAHGDAFAETTRRQAEAAAAAADAILFVVDAREGANPLDEEVATILRRIRRKIILVANKAESPNAADSATAEFSRLGFGVPIVVSAIHGEGTGDLLDRIVEALPENTPNAMRSDEISLAIVGRPNVGKSSLLNALVGQERAIVSDVAGTTRDAIDTELIWRGGKYRLVDTAGMRKRPEAIGDIEYYATLRSLNALARCDIALVVFDSMHGITAQDRRLVGLAIEERKGVILVGNKWDIVREQGEYQQGDLKNAIYDMLPFARFAPITFLSAMTHRKLGGLMPLVAHVCENLDRRAPTGQLNALIRDAVMAHPAPISGGKALRIFYAAQVAAHPPLFIMHCNDPDLVQPSYRRFLEHTIREAYDFEGVPVTIEFRPRRSEEREETTWPTQS